MRAQVTDYVWLATRADPASSSWSVVKLNARSWRRRVAAAKALGQAPPARRKAAEEDASSFVVAVDAAEDVAGPADPRAAARRPAADPALFGGGAFALDVTLAAPAVVADRSGLAPGFLVFARSKDEAARAAPAAPAAAAPPPSTRRCVVAASPLSTRPGGYEARRVGAEAFAEAAAPRGRGARGVVSCDAFRRRCFADARRHARLAWVRDDAEDARFLRDPATTQILTVGGDAETDRRFGRSRPNFKPL